MHLPGMWPQAGMICVFAICIVVAGYCLDTTGGVLIREINLFLKIGSVSGFRGRV